MCENNFELSIFPIFFKAPAGVSLPHFIINDLPNHFNDHCDPVIISEQKVQALMFADDVMIVSQSADGLKRAINITVNYFHDINLKVNFDKSQVMIFNARGVLLDKDPEHQFHARGQVLRVVSEYTYLGIKLTQSGAAIAIAIVQQSCSFNQ